MSDTTDKTKDSVELPAPTAAPLVLGMGIALVGVGFATSLGFTVVGVVVFVFGLGSWIGQLISVLGHVEEPLVEPSLRPGEAVAAPGTVEPMHPGTAGYRFVLPEKVHPISSGVKGGIIGGLLMPIPAMAYGLIVHGSPWLPVNLLVGIVIPGITDATLDDLKAFHPISLILGILIHAAFSVTFGLMYGVILPMLPSIKWGPLLFGGILMPFLWSGVCYGMMGIVNPLMEQHVSWPWFVVSQLVYGLAMSYVVSRSEKIAVAQWGR
ncbi:MAG TPA: hypothetical protein VE988_19730 [Gemmataceae bacterium]|nr:hypothetical protein [Gemmataceae bacterium]